MLKHFNSELLILINLHCCINLCLTAWMSQIQFGYKKLDIGMLTLADCSSAVPLPALLTLAHAAAPGNDVAIITAGVADRTCSRVTRVYLAMVGVSQYRAMYLCKIKTTHLPLKHILPDFGWWQKARQSDICT